MLTKTLVRNLFLYVFTLLISLSVGCKKSKVAPVVQASRADLTRDSIFLYAKEIYLWNQGLPTYEAFNPRKYTSNSSDLLNYESELFDITQLPKNPSTGKSYEYYASDPTYPKYSFIEDKTTANPQASAPNVKSSVNLEGDGHDIGIYSVSGVGTSSNYKLYIKAVSQNSPADKAGLTRAAYITKINNKSIGSNFDNEFNTINDAIFGDPASVYLEGYKIDGTAFSVTLNKTIYKSSPIYKTNILTAGSKKIGYLAFAHFSSKANAEAALDAVFADFSAKGVTDLVIDLRYNGGGYVSTAEHLTNLIAPSSATGTMFAEYYNSNLQNRRSSDQSILMHQPLLDENNRVQYENGKMVTYADINFSVAGNTTSFAKAGNLNNVTNVVFIVSGSTASSSELVINNLKPKMNVKLVGKQTYGKPVGFFPVVVENRYNVYLASFETKNSLGVGGYYNGLTPDVDGGTDYADYDFGNPNDGYLAKALNILAPGVTITNVSSKNAIMSVSSKASGTSKTLIGSLGGDDSFKGMIENRHKLK